MGYREIHEQAGRTGFTTTGQVRAAGVTDDAWWRHARGLGWTPYHRGLWVPAGVALGYRQRVDAALTVVGGDVLVTGASALHLLGVIDQPPGNVELLLPAGRHVVLRSGVCIHRSTAFERVRYHQKGGFQIAAVPRALADHAAHGTLNGLCQHIATALRKRSCTLGLVGAELTMRKRFPGRRNLRLAHGLLSGEITHSGGERLARRLLRDAGHHPHPRPLVVEIAGRPAAEIDIPFADLLYGVEVDGPHHLLADVAAADRARDRALQAVGWHIDRFFWFEVEDRGAWFVAEVTRRLAERTSRT